MHCFLHQVLTEYSYQPALTDVSPITRLPDSGPVGLSVLPHASCCTVGSHLVTLGTSRIRAGYPPFKAKSLVKLEIKMVSGSSPHTAELRQINLSYINMTLSTPSSHLVPSPTTSISDRSNIIP